MRHNQEQQDFFKSIIEGLNPIQRQAVTETEGPMLVIAGPGTGKTHMLSARIGAILQQTDVYPHNVLCLTYTDAGATAMRERLLKFIGTDAYQVPIFTFHGFCNYVIQRNSFYFGRIGLELITDLEMRDLIDRLLQQQPHDHPLRIGKHHESNYFTPHLIHLFQLMNMENWSKSYIEQQIDAYLDSLSTNPEFQYKRKQGQFQKGDVKEAEVRNVRQKMELLRAGATLFEAFKAEKAKGKWFDYSDMIIWVKEAFAKYPYLLRGYQEQFQYVLVDEFQDTSGSQMEILMQLISFWDSPNVFVVGDDDQSIYEFQGARLENMVQFQASFKDQIALVVLEENYRSSQAILDAAGALIKENKLRLVHALQGVDALTKDLVAAKKSETASPRPLIIDAETETHQLLFVFETLKKHIAEGVPLNEIAILYRKHAQADKIIHLLESERIPYITKRPVDVLQSVLVQQLILLLRYLQAESQSPNSGSGYLFPLLHAHFWGLSIQDLNKLAWYKRTQKEDPSFDGSWKYLLLDSERLTAAGIEKVADFEQIGRLLMEWEAAWYNEKPIYLIEQTMNRSGALAYALSQPDKIVQVQVLTAWLDFAKASFQKNPAMTIKEYLDVLQRMEIYRLPISASNAPAVQQGIQLSTLHGAKGLEYEVVFMIDGSESAWKPSGNNYQFNLPDTLTHSQENQDVKESARRLFYVGMTRAKQFLYLSYAKQTGDKKPTVANEFIETIRASGTADTLTLGYSVEALTEIQITQLRPTTPIQLWDIPPSEWLQERVSNLVLSTTSLQQFLKCRLGFYYRYILDIPEVSSRAANYGQAMHLALERYFQAWQRDKDKTAVAPPFEVLANQFKEVFLENEPFLTAKEYAYFTSRGLTFLEGYYERNAMSWHTNVLLEHRISQVQIEGVPMKGVIDRLDVIGKQEVQIVDYKSGGVRSDDTKGPTDKNPHGGKYWRQLVIYRLLANVYTNLAGYVVPKGTISYLEPDKDGHYHTFDLTYAPSDIHAVKSLITDSWKAIQAYDFFTGCEDAHCPWCTLLQQRKDLPKSMFDEELGSLDD